VGSTELLARVCGYLQEQSKKPYAIPVGGSNSIGTWGYINAVDELLVQWESMEKDGKALDAVVFACGSGGTAAGIVLGMALAYSAQNKQVPKLYAVGVCDDPDYFYRYIASIANDMGLTTPNNEPTEDYVRRHMTIFQGKGLGYAVNTQEELDLCVQFAQDTGIVLDSVYTGKALYNFVEHVKQDPESFRGANVLFWHTGGTLGLYDKSGDLTDKLAEVSPCQRLDVYGKGIGIDISKPE
jgi:D-cysteine desulfhydrase